MSKPFIPSQIGMRFAAFHKKQTDKVKLSRSHSPPAIRTKKNYFDKKRRIYNAKIDKKYRAKSVQPRRMPRNEPIRYYRLNNWMEDLYPLIQNKPITEISIPGTHDSATYAITGKSRAASCQKSAKITSLTDDPRQWTMTQTKSIAQQLSIGCRFFDIRVSFEDKEGRFYTHHGLLAMSLPYELKAVRDFLDKHPFEFVIIKIKPASTCGDFLRDLRTVINTIIQPEHLLMKKTFSKYGEVVEKIPADYKMKNCAGKVMVIIDDRTFVEGFEDTPEFRSSSFMFGNTALHSAWPNARRYNDLVQSVIDSQPDKANKQLYCLHFTFTPNAKFIISHMSSKNKVHDLVTLTQRLEEEKEEKTGLKSNWDYLISLLKTRSDTKRDININVVDFLNGMKSHRVILLNCNRNKAHPLPPPLSKERATENQNHPAKAQKSSSSSFFFKKRKK
ncbi:PI-PLC X domain-containing protein 2 [Tritrichomonas musculus]|uniref:PI-PLC X domain-containing protein 2 n=1 Tax=Tritrichomonas musculus TaxID=1915356 RepID=A0ABR2H1L0_9EUKA